MNKVLVLFSGGLDTTLITLKYLTANRVVTPFFVDYNQWEVDQELTHMEDLMDYLGMQYSEDQLEDIVVVGSELPGPPVGHSSGRILMSIGLAVMYADRVGGYSTIATGYRGISHYPESHEDTQDLVSKLLKRLGYKYEVPLLGVSKARIGQELALYQVPFELMYTCYWSPPCGSKSPNDKYLCGGCRNKVEAMVAAGVTSPERLLRPNIR